MSHSDLVLHCLPMPPKRIGLYGLKLYRHINVQFSLPLFPLFTTTDVCYLICLCALEANIANNIDTDHSTLLQQPGLIKFIPMAKVFWSAAVVISRQFQDKNIGRIKVLWLVYNNSCILMEYHFSFL